jgi:hypothetical protein
MSVCHRGILSSRSTVDLLKLLVYGSHCREGVNGNPFLALDYFSLLELLAQSLVRSIASPFDYARVPSCEGTGPTVGCSTAHGIQSRSRCRRSNTYLDFSVATMCDRFSKLVRTVPLRSITSLAVAQEFCSYWGFVYGMPQNLLSDNGVSLIPNSFKPVASS